MNIEEVDGKTIYLTKGTETGEPTVLCSDGGYEYRLKNALHNEKGIAAYYPSSIGNNAREIWAIRGKYHRLNGPALIKANGIEVYYLFHVLHRFEGPAILGNNPDESKGFELPKYFLHGFELTQKEYEEIVDPDDCAKTSFRMYRYVATRLPNNQPKVDTIRKHIVRVLKLLKVDAKTIANLQRIDNLLLG